MPTGRCGNKACMAFLSKNIKYPPVCVSEEASGRVYMQFGGKRWENLPNQGVVFFTGKVRVEIGMRKKITALLPPCCFSGFPEYRTNRKWYGGRGIPSGGSGRCRFPAVLLAVF